LLASDQPGRQIGPVPRPKQTAERVAEAQDGSTEALPTTLGGRRNRNSVNGGSPMRLLVKPIRQAALGERDFVDHTKRMGGPVKPVATLDHHPI